MSEFVERLPWRLAALAGLLVGAASLLGGTDIWVTLLRIGAAFAVFGLLGLGLRELLLPGLKDAPAPQDPVAPAPGAHVDQTTPEMTVEDLQTAEGKTPPRQAGDGSRTP